MTEKEYSLCMSNPSMCYDVLDCDTVIFQ